MSGWTEAEDNILREVVKGYGASPPAWWIEKHLPGRTKEAVDQRVSRVIKGSIVYESGPDRRADNTGLDDGPPMFGPEGMLGMKGRELALYRKPGGVV